MMAKRAKEKLAKFRLTLQICMCSVLDICIEGNTFIIVRNLIQPYTAHIKEFNV